MMAVDILPASIPLDASMHFCKVLLPYLKTLVREYRGERVDDEYWRALNKAIIARDGELVDKHRWLTEPVRAWREGVSPEFPKIELEGASGAAHTHANMAGVAQKKKILMFGSGMVARPAADEIAKRPDVELLVGSYLNPYIDLGADFVHS
jgi:alpha-aminoadipic semialdehyde synthase